MYERLNIGLKIVLLTVGLLSGCAYRPHFDYTRGAPITLPPGEGLVGLRVKFSHNIRFIEFKGVSKGSKTFQIDNPRVGMDLRILHLPPGKYCQYRFGGHDWYLYDKSPTLCFDVSAAMMSYGGDFHEHFRAVSQDLNYKDFLTQLQQEHIDLFKQYFIAR